MGEDIRVIIEKDGKLILKVSGREGPRCVTVTEAFEKEMGQVLDRQRTNEFYRETQIALKNKTMDPLKSA